MMDMKPKVGIINGGGDCPGLNAVIDAIVEVLDPEYEIIGFYRGFEGMLSRDHITLTPAMTTRYRFQGGTFLKTVNKGHFSSKVGHGTRRDIPDDILDKAMHTYRDLGLEGGIALGGDGTMAIAHQLSQKGMNVVGVPKSIDHDLVGTDFTFGFQTAIEIATESLDRLRTTAFSHDRVMILEVMGRNAGWIGLYSGIAGGADIILIPEIPFSWDVVTDYIASKSHEGRKDLLVVVSEGARSYDAEVITKETGGTEKVGEAHLGGIGEHIAYRLNQDATIEARATILGHLQRGGSPSGFDRVLSRGFGARAAMLFKQRSYGHMVTYHQGHFQDVAIVDAVADIKHVEGVNQLISIGRDMGVCFGD